MIFKSRIRLFSFVWLAVACLLFLTANHQLQHFYQHHDYAGIQWWEADGGMTLIAAIFYTLNGLWWIFVDLKTRIALGEDSIAVLEPSHHREIPYSALKRISLINPKFKVRGGVSFLYLDRKQANKPLTLLVDPVDRVAFLSELERRTKYLPIGEQLPLAE